MENQLAVEKFKSSRIQKQLDTIKVEQHKQLQELEAKYSEVSKKNKALI
jgi:hypothetical protein